MTHEEILALAKSAGFGTQMTGLGTGPIVSDYKEEIWGGSMITAIVVRFFHLAYAAGQRDMQERAAKVCTAMNDEYAIPFNAVKACAAAIRNLEVK